MLIKHFALDSDSWLFVVYEGTAVWQLPACWQISAGFWVVVVVVAGAGVFSGP